MGLQTTATPLFTTTPTQGEGAACGTLPWVFSITPPLPPPLRFDKQSATQGLGIWEPLVGHCLAGSIIFFGLPF